MYCENLWLEKNMIQTIPFRDTIVWIKGVVSLLCFFTLLAGTAHGAAPAVIREMDNVSKILRLESEDTITISGIIYKVPHPWQGNRLKTERYTFEDFALIPVEAAHQNSKLYLLKEAHRSFVSMLAKAKEDEIDLKVHSAYRSSSYQKNIIIKMLAEGRDFDDIIRYVAPPGYSEHALATVVDFYPSNWKFASLDAYAWLKDNAKEFGFFETYPQKSSKGQPWEPWHWRFKSEAIYLGTLHVESGAPPSQKQ